MPFSNTIVLFVSELITEFVSNFDKGSSSFARISDLLISIFLLTPVKKNSIRKNAEDNFLNSD